MRDKKTWAYEAGRLFSLFPARLSFNACLAIHNLGNGAEEFVAGWAFQYFRRLHNKCTAIGEDLYATDRKRLLTLVKLGYQLVFDKADPMCCIEWACNRGKQHPLARRLWVDCRTCHGTGYVPNDGSGRLTEVKW